jgi:hypothetical protein
MPYKQSLLILLAIGAMVLSGCSHELSRKARSFGGDAGEAEDGSWHADFSDSGLTDDQFEEFRRLKEFTKVKRLFLNGTRITDKSFKNLEERKDLELLDCGRTRITDQAISSIAGSTEMYLLRVGGTNITDACIPDILTLTNLASLSIHDTGITKNGIAQIEEGLPGCLVFDDSVFDKMNEILQKLDSSKSK